MRSRRSRSPSATCPTRRKIVARDGKPVGDGPYFGVGYDSRTAGADATTPFRLDSGRWATGPGEVVIDAAHGREAALRARLAACA